MAKKAGAKGSKGGKTGRKLHPKMRERAARVKAGKAKRDGRGRFV